MEPLVVGKCALFLFVVNFLFSSPLILPIFADEIRNNQYKYLFRPSSLVSGKEDAANNYARGYYTIGREVIKTVAEAIRREVNQCDSLDGFFFFHSMGGGTGSGLSTLILESLSEDYVKKKQLEFVVYPSPRVRFHLFLELNYVVFFHVS